MLLILPILYNPPNAHTQNLCFSITGENLTRVIREKLFVAILRQDVSWFDEERNSASALATKLSSNAGDMSGVSIKLAFMCSIVG